jgi:hypothetical protein
LEAGQKVVWMATNRSIADRKGLEGKGVGVGYGDGSSRVAVPGRGSIRVVGLSMAIALGVAAGCERSNDTSARLRCEDRMRHIGDALLSYVGRYHHVPSDKAGRLRIASLDCNEWRSACCIKTDELRCPLGQGDDNDGYAVSPLITEADFQVPKARGVIVLAHKSAFLHKLAGAERADVAIVMTADGMVYGALPVDMAQYAKWVKEYEEGSRGSTDFDAFRKRFHWDTIPEEGAAAKPTSAK